MILVALVVVGLAISYWPNNTTDREQARRALTSCVKAGGGPGCYQLPSVRAAVAGGWRPPSYWQILEGSNYHQ